MIGDADFSELIHLIYEGALAEDPWQAFLERICRHFNGRAASMVLRRPIAGELGLMYNYGGIPEGLAAYVEHHFALDPFVNLPEGQVFTQQEFVPPAVLAANTVYAEFLERVDLMDSIGVDLNEPDLVYARFRVARSRAAGPYTEADRVFCRLLVPHLRTAIRMHVELEQVRSARASYAEAMDQLTMAAIIVDESGKVLHTNRLADYILAQNDGLALNKDVLVLSNREDARRFSDAVTRTIEARRNNRPGIPEVMRLRRPSGRADLGMIVRPSSPTGSGQDRVMSHTVAVFLSVETERTEVPAEVIQKLFGLTPAEATLALRLAAGKTLQEAAEDLGISESTARTHLRAIFGKTGNDRQTKLVRAILKSVAMLGQ
jgi:DNA-binding CsgD family transcriptional regulator/PAS domain-containing protein